MPGRIRLRAADPPGSALTWLQAELARAALPDDVVDRALLAVGEVVANVVEHGTAPGGAFAVEWDADAGPLRVTVSESGRGVTAGQIERAGLPADPLDEGGRGLFLIRALSDGVDVENGTVRLTFVARP